MTKTARQRTRKGAPPDGWKCFWAETIADEARGWRISTCLALVHARSTRAVKTRNILERDKLIHLEVTGLCQNLDEAWVMTSVDFKISAYEMTEEERLELYRRLCKYYRGDAPLPKTTRTSVANALDIPESERMRKE